MNDTYYIFSSIQKKPVNVETLNSFSTVLSGAQSKRLFKDARFANQEIFIYKIKPTNGKLINAIENNNYYGDANRQIYRLLTSNDAYFGYSSRHINQILNHIIRYDNNELRLAGENGWKTLGELFETLEKTRINYLVLRKHETLPRSFLDGDHDIDVLCDRLEEIVLATGIEKRNVGISSYCLNIGGEKTDFDIRFLGDYYIDSQWGANALSNRIKNQDGIFVMDNENQLFTILYHCLTQKTSISNYYRREISRLSKIVFDAPLSMDNSELCRTLASYMRTNGYALQKPVDVSVVQNTKNIKLIKSFICRTSEKTEFFRSAYIKTPHLLRPLYPQKFKQKLLND